MSTASAGALVRQSAQTRRNLVGRLHNRSAGAPVITQLTWKVVGLWQRLGHGQCGRSPTRAAGPADDLGTRRAGRSVCLGGGERGPGGVRRSPLDGGGAKDLDGGGDRRGGEDPFFGQPQLLSRHSRPEALGPKLRRPAGPDRLGPRQTGVVRTSQPRLITKRGTNNSVTRHGRCCRVGRPAIERSRGRRRLRGRGRPAGAGAAVRRAAGGLGPCCGGCTAPGRRVRR